MTRLQLPGIALAALLVAATTANADPTVVSGVRYDAAEPFKEPEFFNALLRGWLGPKPADWQLKDALLGKSVQDHRT